MELYTPGLVVAENIRLRRERRLPIPGRVLVRPGERVQAEAVVARAQLPGAVEVINAAGLLGVAPRDVERQLLKRVGDPVEEGELLGQSSGFLGLFRSRCTAPTSGRVESISAVTGQVILRGPPVPVEVAAYVEGRVVEVLPDEGAVLEAQGTWVQGIFGVGGERFGPLAVRVPDRRARLRPEALDETSAGAIVVAGAGVAGGCLERARALGVGGLVVGSLTDRDLRSLVGFDLGSSITGSKDVDLTLILTEGFGDLPMGERTFEVLAACDGMSASVNGRTQIRAGVIRPEVIVARPESADGEPDATPRRVMLRVGSRVRGTREPHFGRCGVVSALPAEPARLETGASVAVAELAFDDGGKAYVPRSNLEAI